jgi:hypothetical protein
MGQGRRDDDRDRRGDGRDRRDGRDGRNRRDGDREKKPWQRHSVELPGTSGQRLWLNEDGGVAARGGDVDPEWKGEYGVPSWRNRMAGGKSADKLNAYLDRTGYSLKGGKGAPVVGYKRIDIEADSAGAVMPWLFDGAGSRLENRPGSTEYVPIYGERTRGGDGGNGRGDGRGDKDKNKNKDKNKGGEIEGAFDGTDEANAAINSGMFDVPYRPTWGEEFLRDYTDREVGGEMINVNAPIMQPNPALGDLDDGYPSSSDWTVPATGSGSTSTGGSSTADDEELARTFAASAAFRNELMGMAAA